MEVGCDRDLCALGSTRTGLKAVLTLLGQADEIAEVAGWFTSMNINEFEAMLFIGINAAIRRYYWSWLANVGSMYQSWLLLCFWSSLWLSSWLYKTFWSLGTVGRHC
ncbi:hypothetical protein IC582_005409 [Cucumis melo]